MQAPECNKASVSLPSYESYKPDGQDAPTGAIVAQVMWQ